MARDEVAALAARGVPHEIVVEDIQAVADAERTRLAARDGTDWFSEYRDVDEVAAYMDRLAERYPDTARTRQLGTSIEDRPIRAIEISRGGEVGIVLNGGHHAREWISVMVPLCIADRLLATHGTDPRVRDILESVTFYVAPLVNPDGYHYSWTFDRYWRKNRRGGYGVDLNRNYSVGWGGAGSSSDQASPTYRGTRPFSEPESRALRALFEAEDVRGHVDFHSYSQLILYPWSHRLDDPPDRDAFAAIADRMSSAIHAVHGERYDVIPGSELGGGVSGTVADWAYGEGAPASCCRRNRSFPRATRATPPSSSCPNG
jgi:carboxypeptidase T